VTRPPVDVVVPFRGPPAELDELRARLRRIELRDRDSVVVADNTPGRGPSEGAVPVVAAAAVPTPGFARNRGAEVGSGDWLVFLDADAVPSEDLLDRYFDPLPRERAGLLAGGVLDEAVPADGPATARYSYLRGTMRQEAFLGHGEWGFPKTANAAFRRTAFEAVGGFREDIRAAEDADLAYRLRAEGWEIERREQAAVVHLSRKTLREFLAQKLSWGAGAHWLSEAYPGAFPARRRPGLVWWGARTAVKELVGAARARDRDRAIVGLLDPLEQLAYEFGRSIPNTRPLPERPLWNRLGLWRAG
jgi:mycofactocin glycosyltransferase